MNSNKDNFEKKNKNRETHEVVSLTLTNLSVSIKHSFYINENMAWGLESVSGHPWVCWICAKRLLSIWGSFYINENMAWECTLHLWVYWICAKKLLSLCGRYKKVNIKENFLQCLKFPVHDIYLVNNKLLLLHFFFII